MLVLAALRTSNALAKKRLFDLLACVCAASERGRVAVLDGLTSLGVREIMLNTSSSILFSLRVMFFFHRK